MSEEMSQKDLAEYFGIPNPPSETEKEDDSNGIYKIAARIKNKASILGNLTPNGIGVCNTFVHVLKAFYDFAETMKDSEEKAELLRLVRAQEVIPANFIAALASGVKLEKDSS